ncbi:hypothetical protein DFQ28_011750 [Apophysomyces sp. BC1034]|nr:hypothetical protein DFQ28_011750 [Apophysomyces sp. BC1034]
MPDSGNNGGFMSGLQSYMQGKSSTANQNHKNNGSNSNGSSQSKRPSDLFYAVLKHGTLFLYESEQKEKIQEVIPIHDYLISMYPERKNDAGIFGRSSAVMLEPKGYAPVNATDDGPDGKKNVEDEENEQDAKRGGEEEYEVKPMAPSASAPDLSKGQQLEMALTLDRPLYLFCARSVEKEDWYLALTEASKLMANSEDYVEMVDSTMFDQQAMDELLNKVYNTEEQREMQWLNAIFGRVFLGMYKTETVRQIVEHKLAKKAKKVKRPAFLEEIHVQHVDVGHAVPCITKPRLVSLSPEGHLIVEANMEYAGNLSVVIETNLNWSFTMRRKPIRVNLVLSVKLKSISGKLMLKIKPPPSNRYWIGFYEMPKMELEITPVVSDKQIKLSMVTNAIEAKIREFMLENIVLPNMDDIPFCNSGGKGGIFGERVPKKAGTTWKMEEDTESLAMEDQRTDGLKPSVHRAESDSTGLNHQVKTSIADAKKAKSSPDLQPTTETETATATTTATATAIAVADDQASIRSIESHQSAETTASQSSSSTLRWSAQLLHKRRKTITSGTASETESITDDNESADNVSLSARSIGTKGFFSKIQRRKSDLNDDARSNKSSGSKTSFYQGLLHKNKELEQERKSDMFADRLADMRRRYNESKIQHFRPEEELSSAAEIPEAAVPAVPAVPAVSVVPVVPVVPAAPVVSAAPAAPTIPTATVTTTTSVTTATATTPVAVEAERPPLPPRRLPTPTSSAAVLTGKDSSQATFLPSPAEPNETNGSMQISDGKESVTLDQPLVEVQEATTEVVSKEENEKQREETKEREEEERTADSKPLQITESSTEPSTENQKPVDNAKPPLPPREPVMATSIPPPIPPRHPS